MLKLAVGIFLAEIAVELDRAQFDRPLALIIAPHRIGHGRQQLFAHLGFARQIFRRRHVRHFGLMVEARLVGVERHQHGEDRMAVLARGDAPRREALAVADAIDVVDDRHFGIARQQEIGVHASAAAGSSTVRTAATSAWPITWPPNTRCQPTCGERPRNRFTSSGSRSRMIEQIVDGGRTLSGASQMVEATPSTCYARRDLTRNANE